MSRKSPENARIKRQYFEYLKAAKGYDEATVDAHADAIARFERSTGGKPFKAFHIAQATAFRDKLHKELSKTTGKPLSKSTVYQTLTAMRAFVLWLAGQPGFKRRIQYADADYFKPSLKDARTVSSRPERPFPTLEQVRHAILTMQAETEIQRRDRAIVAFTLLTGARDRATVTLQLRDVDVVECRVVQDGRHVATKFGKTIETWFSPVGADIENIVIDWIGFLRSEKLFAETDPLFPATLIAQDANRRFVAQGLSRRFWKSADPVRTIFRNAFERAGLRYFNPHSLRNTLTQLGERICQTPEAMKAWSQNLGHENVATTLNSYGRVAAYRQGELIRSMGAQREAETSAPAAVQHVQSVV